MVRHTDTFCQMVESLSNSEGDSRCISSSFLSSSNGGGTGNRILQGDQHLSLWNVIEYCIREGQEMDATVTVGLNKMHAAAPDVPIEDL